MKKFLNRTVAAIAAGCFLMPSAECVTGGKSCADGKNTGTETCSELEPKRKIRRTRSLPDLSDASVQREEDTGTETCSELEPERKIRRTRSFPDLSDVSVQREIEKNIPGDTYNQIQKVLEDRSSFVADSPIKLDSYEMEKSISENLFKLDQELGNDLRIRKMLYGIEQKYLSYWENSENRDCSPEDDIKKTSFENILFKFVFGVLWI